MACSTFTGVSDEVTTSKTLKQIKMTKLPPLKAIHGGPPFPEVGMLSLP